MLMYIGDALAIGFLISWIAGLLTELQRSEGLSLEKLLHLPVSLNGAFLMNYLTSLASLTMVIFLPPMIGLSLGLVFSRGPGMLLLGPLVAGFLLMVTAVTYQFQGWLASLMVNKRRRRMVIVLVTSTFILLGQLPNLINLWGPWRSSSDQNKSHPIEESAQIHRAFESGQITREEYDRRQAEISEAIRPFGGRPADGLPRWDRMSEAVVLANIVFPPGWMALGIKGLAEGQLWPALLATVGMTMIGTVSLRRSYRTTLRMYTGSFTKGKRVSVAASSQMGTAMSPPASDLGQPGSEEKIAAGTLGTHHAGPAKARFRLLEMKIPGLSEHASIVSLAGLRSFLRAPEAIMMVLTPVIMVLVFGGVILRNRSSMPETFRPLVAFGAMAIVLLSYQQIMGNQFGFDRNGFRVFVLSPARRRDILLGKNLTMAPLILGLAAIMAIFIQVFTPMRLEQFLAVPLQCISMFMVFCMLANCLSIFGPAPVAGGAFKRGNIRGIPLLLHFAFMFAFPLTQAPMLLPFALEYLLEDLSNVRGLPICFVLSLGQLLAVAFLYRLVLDLEGNWLQAREKKILEIVAAKAD
jgi:ABC-2 type transport system permease protein